MGLKTEISWKRRLPDGERREVYVRHVGDQWRFFYRGRRFEQWQPLENPPLEDWLELLDAVERRIHRRLLRPEEAGRIRHIVATMFPDAAG